MKRLIAIPLLFLYLTAVSGAMIQIHYCGNRIASWDINKSSSACCCESGDHDKPAEPSVTEKNCCFNKTITLKISEAQSNISQATGFLSEIAVADIIPVIHFPGFSVPVRDVQRQSYLSHAPPGRWQNIPLYKLHSRFTYYG